MYTAQCNLDFVTLLVSLEIVNRCIDFMLYTCWKILNSGFEILRFGHFCHFNQFLWYAYCVPSIFDQMSVIGRFKYKISSFVQGSIFQTFWKVHCCTKSMFFELEISNCGCLLIFWFSLTVQIFSKIGQHWY